MQMTVIQEGNLYLKLGQIYNEVKRAKGQGTAGAGPTGLQVKGNRNTTRFRNTQCVAEHVIGRGGLRSTNEKSTALGGEFRASDRVAEPGREGDWAS